MENIKFAEVFGTPTCGYCGAAKALLDKHKIEYNYVDLSQPGEKQKLEMRLSTSIRTVPQIILNGEYIGGYKELAAKLA